MAYILGINGPFHELSAALFRGHELRVKVFSSCNNEVAWLQPVFRR